VKDVLETTIARSNTHLDNGIAVKLGRAAYSTTTVMFSVCCTEPAVAATVMV
jgi:hypothetical protein